MCGTYRTGSHCTLAAPTHPPTLFNLFSPRLARRSSSSRFRSSWMRRRSASAAAAASARARRSSACCRLKACGHDRWECVTRGPQDSLPLEEVQQCVCVLVHAVCTCGTRGSCGQGESLTTTTHRDVSLALGFLGLLALLATPLLRRPDFTKAGLLRAQSRNAHGARATGLQQCQPRERAGVARALNLMHSVFSHPARHVLATHRLWRV